MSNRRLPKKPPRSQNSSRPLRGQEVANSPTHSTRPSPKPTALPNWLSEKLVAVPQRPIRSTQSRLEPERERSHKRRWPYILPSLLLIPLGLYVLAPSLAIAIARNYLPRDVGSGVTITDLRGAIEPAPVALALYVRPGRARRIIDNAGKIWMPPWLLRRGQNASGTARITDEDTQENTDLTWRCIISGEEPRPTLVVHLSASDAGKVLAPYASIVLDANRGIEFHYDIEHAKVEQHQGADQLPDVWNLHMEGAGRISLAFGGDPVVVPVAVVAALRVWFHRVDKGWIPAAILTIEHIEGTGTDAPMINAPATRKQLEGVVNATLKRRLAEVVLPAWFPTDAVVEADIE